MWLRPTETSEAAIAASVKKIKNSGIDNVFIETYFHGRTIFPSKTMQKYGFIEQNEKFNGIDPLKYGYVRLTKIISKCISGLKHFT